MYKIKEEEMKKMKKRGNTRGIANKTGYSEGYISQLLHGRKFKNKLLAEAIVSFLSSESEIEDFFEIF